MESQANDRNELTALKGLEDAALAVGRLDAAARSAPVGLAELLVLRCAAQAFGAGRDGMIALLHPEGEGAQEPHRFLVQLRAVPAATEMATPSLLGAALAARRKLREPGAGTGAVAAAALAAIRSLQSGGAIGGAWLSFPLGPGSPLSVREDDDDSSSAWLPAAYLSLEREARAVERGLGAARHRVIADEQRVRDAMGRASYSALRVLALLAERLVLNVPDVARALRLTPPTANAAIRRLEAMGIAREVTGRERSRRFVYLALLEALAP